MVTVIILLCNDGCCSYLWLQVLTDHHETVTVTDHSGCRQELHVSNKFCI